MHENALGNSVNDNQRASGNIVVRGVSHASPQVVASEPENVVAHALGEKRQVADHTREEVDAKIAASEARNETKIARIEGKLDQVIDKLNNLKDDGRATRANIWVVGIGIVLLIGALIAAFPVYFDLGSHIAEQIQHSVETTKR